MKDLAMSVANRVVLVFVATIGASLGAFVWGAENAELTVRFDRPGAKISPMLNGLMTEEINHAYDGGLYAELIQNRAFKDGTRGNRTPEPTHPPHWTLVKTNSADGSMALDTSDPVNATALTTSLRLDMKGGAGQIGVANDGFWGIPVKANTVYKASFYVRATADVKGPLTLAIESNDGSTVHASATVEGIGTQWKKCNATLKTGKAPTSVANRFLISAPCNGAGSLWLSLVSLFPPTYNNRSNGLRIDLMEMLAGLKPAFLRFPGGNYLEGPDYNDRFNWKTTIGPLEERPGHQCPWGYRSSDGLGLLEFLEWCEDLKMEPVLAVYAGLHIDNGRNIITGDALRPHVQDALDEIEYVSGDKTTEWGARRAKDGHPDPFKLTYVEIGNEDNLNNGGRTYNDRFAMFYDAIKAKYPSLQIISTIPSNVSLPNLTNLTRRPDVIDDHLYNPAASLMRQSTRYDSDRYRGDVPKIFMGEWASQEGRPTPNMNSALGDAAFLSGLERNSDVVVMECYVPLLVNVNPGASQWGTNLIGYNAASSFASPSYYAQKMFAENRGDRVLPVELKMAPEAVAESPIPKGGVGVGTWATQSEYKEMKVTAGDQVVYSLDQANVAKDWRTGTGAWSWDGGTLRQNSDATDCRATAGNAEWTDYSYTLKARKISGSEGFLILFHVRNRDDFLWWNVGGWGNSRTAIQKHEHGASVELGRSRNVRVKENQWYDVKIELKERQIRCYLDGQLVADVVDQPQPPPAPIYATASRDDASGDVILKVVNVSGTPRSLAVNLQGITNVKMQLQVDVLSGQSDDVNTLEHPTKVATKQAAIEDVGTNFVHEFPAYSVNVIRCHSQ